MTLFPYPHLNPRGLEGQSLQDKEFFHPESGFLVPGSYFLFPVQVQGTPGAPSASANCDPSPHSLSAVAWLALVPSLSLGSFFIPSFGSTCSHRKKGSGLWGQVQHCFSSVTLAKSPLLPVEQKERQNILLSWILMPFLHVLDPGHISRLAGPWLRPDLS